MNKNHDCGSCVNFQKWKNDKLSSGLCELYDARADTDRGRKCKDFKRIKFHRNIRSAKDFNALLIAH